MKALKITLYTVAALALITLSAWPILRWGAHLQTVAGFAFAAAAVVLLWGELRHHTFRPEQVQLFLSIITYSVMYAVINVLVSAVFIYSMATDNPIIETRWMIILQLILALGIGALVAATASEARSKAKQNELNDLYRQVYGKDYEEK